MDVSPPSTFELQKRDYRKESRLRTIARDRSRTEKNSEAQSIWENSLPSAIHPIDTESTLIDFTAAEAKQKLKPLLIEIKELDTYATDYFSVQLNEAEQKKRVLLDMHCKCDIIEARIDDSHYRPEDQALLQLFRDKINGWGKKLKQDKGEIRAHKYEVDKAYFVSPTSWKLLKTWNQREESTTDCYTETCQLVNYYWSHKRSHPVDSLYRKYNRTASQLLRSVSSTESRVQRLLSRVQRFLSKNTRQPKRNKGYINKTGSLSHCLGAHTDYMRTPRS